MGIYKIVTSFISVSLLFVLCSCGVNTEPSRNLIVYVGLYDDLAIKAMESFEKETGINVTHYRMSSSAILEKIREEKDEPIASVWYGGPSDTFIQAKSEGLLQPYISPNAAFISDEYKDTEGYWTGIYVGSIAVVTNRSWLQDIGLTPPQSWQDLLEPEFRGRITVPNPSHSGTGYTILSTLVQLMGEDQAFDYLVKLDENINTYTASGSAPGRMVGMGESGVAIMFAHDALKFYKEGFRDIHISFPAEGTGYEIGAVGLIKGIENLEEAKAFIDWSLTKQAQEIGKQMGNYQLLTNEQAISPEEAYYLTESNIISYDKEWSGLHRDYLLKRWQEEVIQ
ncbi:ABC transporter substrate-binding protein [Alkalihalobacillus trypoxylicola]|uniref:Iron ABC transporter substrate-binding protein n=1 Tax=Alkalihalobacillus trypoxylicola TaxID=519424 RepID=A0A162ENQ3_9BACI|nr:ABC transporter substrate-binding protein [Alkalihalobacillus trypoxylicola]KYG33357.1 iron ABC transporter substrate-binding protein [Alkalihalobacillus trypoxylicola]